MGTELHNPDGVYLCLGIIGYGITLLVAIVCFKERYGLSPTK